jgi:hypothetical protein
VWNDFKMFCAEARSINFESKEEKIKTGKELAKQQEIENGRE